MFPITLYVVVASDTIRTYTQVEAHTTWGTVRLNTKTTLTYCEKHVCIITVNVTRNTITSWKTVYNIVSVEVYYTVLYILSTLHTHHTIFHTQIHHQLHTELWLQGNLDHNTTPTTSRGTGLE